MTTWTMYWPEWMCGAAREQGLTGQPLRLLWGGHNAQSTFHGKLTPGDVIIPITCDDGFIRPLGAMRITERTDAEAWLGKHPDDARLRLHGCGSQLLVGDPLHALSFERQLTPEQMKQFSFEAPRAIPRPLKGLTDGRVKATTQLQGVYRVTGPTAALLEDVLAASKAPPKADDLEAQLAEKPDDARLARVVADQLLERGDPRGELIALELQLATIDDPAEAARVDAALVAAARKLDKALPGGFPYRRVFDSRTYTEVRLPAAPLPPSGVEGLSALFPKARRFAPAKFRGRAAEVITGPLLVPGTALALPLQAAALWTGRGLTSEVTVQEGQLWAALRIPDGSPVCAAAVKHFEATLLGATLERRRRTARGDTAL